MIYEYVAHVCRRVTHNLHDVLVRAAVEQVSWVGSVPNRSFTTSPNGRLQ